MKALSLVGLSFAVVYLSCLFWEQEINAVLWILSSFVWLLLWGSGIVLLLLIAPQVCKRWGNPKQRGAALLTLLLVMIPFAVQYQFGGSSVRDLRFRLARPRYEARVKQMLHSPQALERETATRQVMLDRTGGVTRIVFVEPGGMLDNWVGIVYDPTGAVEQINQVKGWEDWGSSRLADIRHLFGGDMTYAHPLGGGWYRCSFT